MSLHPIKSRRKSRKAYSQLRAREEWKPWKGWNWNNAKKFEPSKHRRLILAGFLLITLLFGSNAVLGSAFHPPVYSNRVFQQGPDPTVLVGTRVFHILLPGGALTEFNTFVPSGGSTSVVDCSASYEANSKCIAMKNNSTHTVIALTKTAISLSSAANNNLAGGQFWKPNSPFGGSTVSFGWYLTTNSTVPTKPGYDPRGDPSVFLVSTMACASGCGTSTQQIDSSVWMLRNIGDTLFQENLDCGPNAGAIFLCNTQTFSVLTPVSNYIQLNYTGFTNVPSTVNCGTNPTLTGSGCSFQQNFSGTPTQNGIASTTFLPPFKFQAHEFYYGLFVDAGVQVTIQFGTDNNNDDFCCGLKTVNLAEINNGVTTAGFFQPLVDALVATGVFILSAILKFVAFITPALQSALTFLESIIETLLNAIGSLIGYPTAGTNLFTAINALLSFFGQASSIFSNVPALFSRFVDVNSAYFSWLPTALSIALNIATLAVNSVSFVLTIIQFTFKLVAGVYLIILLTLFLVYTGDDSLGGILGFLETTQWLIIGPLGWLARILNFILDIITSIIGLIPKPFVQMVAHAFPRIPIVETSARFVNPSFDLAAIRSGNMLAVWAWFVDFTFLAWYNGISPALPGSLGNLLPGMPATTFAALRGFLPVLEIFLIIISALAFIIWPANKMLSVFALDLDILDFEMSPGRKISSTGFGGGIRLKGAQKHFQAGLEKKVNRKKMQRIERETRKVISKEEEQKIKEQTEKLKEESRQLEKLAERNK